MYELVDINKDSQEGKDALKKLLESDKSLHPSTLACMLYVLETKNPENLSLLGLYEAGVLVGWVYVSFESRSVGRTVYCSYSILNYRISEKSATKDAGRYFAAELSNLFVSAIKERVRKTHAKHIEVWTFTASQKKGDDWIVNKIDKTINLNLRKSYLGRLTLSFLSDKTLRPYFEIEEA